jgi:exonuclease III
MNKSNTQEPLSFVSLNTNGLGEIKKRGSVIGWMKNTHKGDNKVIFLQETHTTEQVENLWKSEWNNTGIYFSHGTSGSTGVAIILPKTVDYQVDQVTRSKNGRYIALNVTIGKNKYCMINCYAPNTTHPKDQLKWLQEIQEILELNSDKLIVVGGDLNDVFIPMLDRYRCKPKSTETEYIKVNSP